MAKTKFFRVFTEGDTTDGRVIQGKWIEEIAATYNPNLYGARIWMEHMRSMYPDSVFRAYGDVTAVKAEKLPDGRLALYAQLDPTADLIAINKTRQKIYTSAEIDPDFAKTGKCYLTGLAVTDSPASLSTEMLAFAAQAPTNPLIARKQSPASLFTAAAPFTLEFEDTMTNPNPSPSEKPLLEQIKALFAAAPKQDPKPADKAEPTDTAAALLEVAGQVAGFSNQLAQAGQAAAKEVAGISAKLTESEKAFAELKAAHDKLLADFNALTAKLDADPANPNQRDPATGGNGATSPGY